MKKVILSFAAILALCCGCVSPDLSFSASRSSDLLSPHSEFTTSGTYTVRGASSQPGAYPIKGRMTLSQAVAAAGGLASDASGEIDIVRSQGNLKARHYTLDAIVAGTAKDPSIKDGDMIIVLRSE